MLKNKPLKPTMRQLEDYELARTAEWVVVVIVPIESDSTAGSRRVSVNGLGG